jgi:hypothetical protein
MTTQTPEADVALDEGAREAARADLGRLLAEVKARVQRPRCVVDFPEEVPWDTPAHPNLVADIEAVQAAISNAVVDPSLAFLSALERLLWLLDLSEGERRFVTALADDWAGDFDGLSVFADWLEDQGRPEDGIRVRRLVPRDGDVIVVRHPPGPRHEAHCASVQQMLDALAARGVRVWAVTMSDDMTLETAPPAAMRAAGWVRAVDVAHRLRHLAEQVAGNPYLCPETVRADIRSVAAAFSAPEAPP